MKFLRKFTKKNSGGGVREDVNEELKFLRKFTKKKFGEGGGGGESVGVRVGGGGQGGCEVFVKIQKKKLGGGGSDGGVGSVGGSGWM